MDDDVVRKAMRSFPKDSGGGPCGLRPQHLRDAILTGFEHEFVRQLAALVNILAKGKVPPKGRPHMSGAFLAALPKVDGSLRPIAVCEVIRRLVSKCLVKAVADDALRLLEPWPVGVGTPGGCKAVPHVS